MALPKEVLKLIAIIDKEDHETVKTVTSPNKLKLGHLYIMAYSPKWKSVLPFYDILPMFMILGKSGDRVLALNFHYLPYTWRKSIVSKLMKKLAQKKRALKYKDVKQALESAKVPDGYLYMCIRTYLYSHIVSKVKEFDSQNYLLVLENVMPRFKKETEEKIYKSLMSKFYKRVGGIKKRKSK